MQECVPKSRESVSSQSGSMAGPSIDAGIERAINLWTHDKWEVVQDAPDLPHISYSSTCSGRESTCTVRMRITDPFSFSIRNVISRPEFVCEHPECGQSLSYKLVELLAPGQAIVNMGFERNELKHAVTMLVGGIYQQVRLCKRRDYPRPGVTVVILQALDDGGNGVMMYLEELVLLSYNIICEATTPESCTSWHILEIPWPTYPAWATQFLNEVGNMDRRLPSAPLDECIRLAEKFYIVLCLQCCSRGPPLIPYACPEDGTEECFSTELRFVKVGGFAWAPAQDRGFNFPLYLQGVLEILGFEADIWDSLDGRRLVPYQACIRGDVWEAVSEKFAQVFQCQRSAYRFLHGGKSAPKVRVATDPHFLDVWETPERKIRPTQHVLEERNTFLNLADPVKVSISGLQMRRAAEYP